MAALLQFKQTTIDLHYNHTLVSPPRSFEKSKLWSERWTDFPTWDAEILNKLGKLKFKTKKAFVFA